MSFGWARLGGSCFEYFAVAIKSWLELEPSKGPLAIDDWDGSFMEQEAGCSSRPSPLGLTWLCTARWILGTCTSYMTAGFQRWKAEAAELGKSTCRTVQCHFCHVLEWKLSQDLPCGSKTQRNRLHLLMGEWQAILQKGTWDGKYCCQYLRKLWSATSGHCVQPEYIQFWGPLSPYS